MQFGIHHHVHRKRQKETQDDGRWKRMINRAAYLAGIMGPVFTIDQIEKVWIQQDVSGVSLVTWGANTLFSIVWTMYGITHKERAVIITNGLWVIVNGLVAIGIWLYG